MPRRFRIPPARVLSEPVKRRIDLPGILQRERFKRDILANGSSPRRPKPRAVGEAAFRARMIRLLSRKAVKPAALCIVIPKGKAEHFEFLKDYAKGSTVGKWTEQSTGPLSEPNILITVGFQDTEDNRIGKELEKTLEEFARKILEEKALRFYTSPAAECFPTGITGKPTTPL